MNESRSLHCPKDPVQEGIHYFDGEGVCIYCQCKDTNYIEVVTPPCILCGNPGIVRVTKEGLELWKSGTLIQNAFPELDADQKELLISGTHAHCWKVLFAEGEDENG